MLDSASSACESARPAGLAPAPPFAADRWVIIRQATDRPSPPSNHKCIRLSVDAATAELAGCDTDETPNSSRVWLFLLVFPPV